MGKRGRKSGIKKKGNLYLPIFLLFMELQGKLHFSKILTKRKTLSLQRKAHSFSKKVFHS